MRPVKEHSVRTYFSQDISAQGSLLVGHDALSISDLIYIHLAVCLCLAETRASSALLHWAASWHLLSLLSAFVFGPSCCKSPLSSMWLCWSFSGCWPHLLWSPSLTYDPEGCPSTPASCASTQIDQNTWGLRQGGGGKVVSYIMYTDIFNNVYIHYIMYIVCIHYVMYTDIFLVISSELM